MGADLLTANLWSRRKEGGRQDQFDWEAGLKAARELSDESCKALHEQAAGVYGEDWDEDDSPRLLALVYVETLRKHIDGFSRDLNVITTPDGRWTCWVTGGLSWGDSPSGLFDAINDLWSVPEVLEALGFWAGDES